MCNFYSRASNTISENISENTGTTPNLLVLTRHFFTIFTHQHFSWSHTESFVHLSFKLHYVVLIDNKTYHYYYVVLYMSKRMMLGHSVTNGCL